MIVFDGIHEKNIFTEKYPFRLSMNTDVNFDYPAHWHSAIEMVYAFKNDCKVIVNNKEYVLKETEILMIGSGDVHSFHTGSTGGAIILMQFDVGFLDAFLSMSAVIPYLSYTQKFTSTENGQLHDGMTRKINEIYEEYNARSFAYELSINAKIFDMIVMLSRNFSHYVHTIDGQGSYLKSYKMEQLNRAFRFIEDNYRENIMLSDVAKASGFSETHFSRIFKEFTDENFHAYLNRFRIKKAEKLLISSTMTILEIAHAVGFNSLVTFNRVFKETNGCTPTLYKQTV